MRLTTLVPAVTVAGLALATLVGPWLPARAAAEQNRQHPDVPAAAASATYQQMLDEADAVRPSDPASALTTYAALTESKAADVPATVRASAMRGMVAAQNSLRARDAGMLRLPLRFVRTYMYPVPAWVLWPAILVLAVAGRRRYAQAHPTSSTLVSFEDLSAPRDERLDKSRVLTRSLLHLLQNPMPVQMSDLHMDTLPGTDEPGYGGLRPTLEMESANTFEPSEKPVRIAALEFSPRDVFALASRFLATPHLAHLEGWVADDGDSTVACARLLDQRRRPVEHQAFESLDDDEDDPALLHVNDATPRFDAVRRDQPASKQAMEWRVRRTGPDARRRAIADLAAQVFVDTRSSRLTRNWQSFRHFHEAVQSRVDDSSTPLADVAAVRSHLEQAVSYDPSNWIARFNLALVLCRDNEPHTALKHFTMLEDVIAYAWPRRAVGGTSARRTAAAGPTCTSTTPAFADVLRHLRKYPECAFLILYNKAIALTSLRDAESERGAVEILGQLADLTVRDRANAFRFPYCDIASEDSLTDRSRMELRLYAISAQANLWATGHLGSDARADASDRTAEKRIRAILAEIDTTCLQEQEQHWPSLQTARAVTLTALARVHAASGNPGARDCLQAALAAEPRLVDAHLLLGELFMRYRQAWAEDWAIRAESLLKRCLVLSPACQRAARLLGNLHADPSAGRLDEAERLLRIST